MSVVTDEAVEAAIVAERAAWNASAHDHGDAPSTGSMRSALTAALPLLSQRAGVTVKPLEWSNRGDDWYAESQVGQYAVGLVHGSFVAMLRGIMSGNMDDLRIEAQPFDDADEAKAAAQADYERRVGSCLIWGSHDARSTAHSD